MKTNKDVVNFSLLVDGISWNSFFTALTPLSSALQTSMHQSSSYNKESYQRTLNYQFSIINYQLLNSNS